MARPPLPLGTGGRIRWFRTNRGWRARCLYRDYDGVSREIERVGRTKYAAENNLRQAIRDRARVSGGADITPGTRLSVLAQAWYASLVDHSPSTMQAYQERLDANILPALGQVRIRELSVGLMDRHLTAIKTNHGPAVAKQTRSVLSGILGLGCRLDRPVEHERRPAQSLRLRRREGTNQPPAPQDDGEPDGRGRSQHATSGRPARACTSWHDAQPLHG
jgi:hypothetical protein